jgi:phage baseplate assembly protein W
MLFFNSIKFPDMFSLTSGSTAIEEQFTSINRCIALILTTAKGELIMNPDFGCTLYEQLFNTVDEELYDLIKTSVASSITKYETRVDVVPDGITITKMDGTPTSYNINIKYNVKNSELTNEMEILLREDDYR